MNVVALVGLLFVLASILYILRGLLLLDRWLETPSLSPATRELLLGQTKSTRYVGIAMVVVLLGCAVIYLIAMLYSPLLVTDTSSFATLVISIVSMIILVFTWVFTWRRLHKVVSRQIHPVDAVVIDTKSHAVVSSLEYRSS